MPDDEPRRSMIGAPPSKRTRGGNTPSAATSTPVAPRSSARASKRVKREEPEEDEFNGSDAEKSEEEESEDSGEEMKTPSKKTPGGGGGAGSKKKKRIPLTDYHLKKKKIMARKAAREAEKEKEIEEEIEEVEKEPTPPPPRKPPSFSDFTPIQLMQEHIIRKLVEKDPEQYFSYPVTPSMAPDYFDIIKTPMDLQTIREKIEDALYATLPSMKEDCMLIVKNALQYNQPTTVFYLAAKRLCNLINYYFGEPYLRYLFHSLPSANKVPFELVGIRPLATVTHDRPVNRRKGVVRDAMTSEDCLQSADAKVRDRLSSRIPSLANAENKAKMGFLSEKNGTVVLNVVAGSGPDEARPNENHHHRRVTIGDIVGPLEEGTAGMIQMQDHRLFSQATVNYLNYGPFSSFAPMYDSTWATMTKSDTDLFLRTYGDKANAQSVQSMRGFLENCPEFLEIVDKKLDGLTDDEHSKVVEKSKKTQKEESMGNEEYKNDTIMSLLNDVSSLSNLGIDVGFLKDVRDQVLLPVPEPAEPENAIPEYMQQMSHMNTQQQLNHIGQELKDLQHLQETRLCQPPPTMLMAQAPEPGIIETKLAVTVQQHLAHQMAQHTVPDAFVNDAVIHDAIGVDMDDGDLFSEFFVTQ